MSSGHSAGTLRHYQSTIGALWGTIGEVFGVFEHSTRISGQKGAVREGSRRITAAFFRGARDLFRPLGHSAGPLGRYRGTIGHY